MTLEERYNSATADSYVGRVKLYQASDAGPIDGVNFFDGDPRGNYGLGITPPPDAVQKEFKRGAEGDFRYGGGGKVPGAGTGDPKNQYQLSRWLTRGVEKGDTYLTNNRYTTVSDARNASTLLQKYNWLKEDATFAGKLPELSKGRVNGAASGPSPARNG